MQRDIEDKKRIVVGVNEYVEDEPPIEGLAKADRAVGERQAARLRELRAERDNRQVDRLLGQLEKAASGTENLIPLLVDCVENEVTLGEICRVLRGVWGEYQGASAI